MLVRVNGNTDDSIQFMIHQWEISSSLKQDYATGVREKLDRNSEDCIGKIFMKNTTKKIQVSYLITDW